MAKEVTTAVTMRVRVGESELEVTGPIDFVERKIAEFVEQQKSLSIIPMAGTVQKTLTSDDRKKQKQMSVGQFFKKVSPKSEVARVLAAGFYIESFRNEESFTAAEISRIIREAKIQPPKNANDSVNQNIKKGHIMAAGDKEGKMAFVLTSDGEEAIDELLNS